MPLLDQIQKDMVAAMKAKDEARLSAIRMVKSALQKFQVDSMKGVFQGKPRWYFAMGVDF